MNETVTSSDINVAIDRPTSWYFCRLPTGPSWMKMNRVGTQTSVSSANRMAFCRRMNATSGSVKQSTSPTRIFDASAPGGIFFKKCSLNYKHRTQLQPATTGFLSPSSPSSPLTTLLQFLGYVLAHHSLAQPHEQKSLKSFVNFAPN